MLENDVRSAVWKARVLSTQSDLELAEAALSAELVELEALYQRAPSDARVAELLAQDFWMLADGFIEVHRLDAVAAGNDAEATRQQQRQEQARARRSYYLQQERAGSEHHVQPDSRPEKRRFADAWRMTPARAACAAHDRAAYERQLNHLLQARENGPEDRLDLALAQRLAASWLQPAVSARCRF